MRVGITAFMAIKVSVVRIDTPRASANSARDKNFLDKLSYGFHSPIALLAFSA